MRSSRSALTQQAVSTPRCPVPNERRRRRPPHGRRTGTTGEWPPAIRGSPRMIMVISCASALNRVAAEPVVEADGAEAGAIAGRQRAVVQLGSEVAPVYVRDHLALVAARGQEFARELVHRTGLRARNLDGAV